jgi:hypothetical protein
MTNSSSKGISLGPSSFEENSEQEILVRGLIGSGVTVIATPEDKDHLRYIFCEQMAAAIAKGDKFLDFFETAQCRVLLVAHGLADFKGMEERGIATANNYLDIRDEWPRIGDGCIKELQNYKRMHPDFKVAFLGNFDFLKSILGNWIEKKLKVDKQNLSKGNYAFETLIKEMEIENVQRLRNFCIKNKIFIIVGHDLNKNGNRLLYTRGLYKCDTEIHIREANEDWRLKVVPKMQKRHIQTHTWDMIYDDQNFFQIHEQQIREARKMKIRSEGQLPLNDNEMKIIDAMWGQGPMSVKLIAEATGISRSTVGQRIEALEESNKGHWVVLLKGDKGKEYVVDTTKERDWI